MKTLQLVPAMEQGGVERGVVEINRAIVAEGWENVVVSAGGRLAAQIEADGGRHITLDVKSKNPLTFLYRAHKLRKLREAERPDVVCAHSRLPAWLFVRANRKLHIPWISFAHGANSISRYSSVMTRGDLIVTPSHYIAGYLIVNYHVSMEKVRVIPRAIDRERFDPEKLDHEFMEAKRKEWGLDGRYVVMGIGRITQIKSYDILINAVAALGGRYKLVIVGEAELLRKGVERELKRLVKDIGAEDNVIFVGNQSKIAECLALSNVLVSSNTQKPEAFGRSMMEAIAMGRPVVAKAFGGALDIVDDGVNGALVPGLTPPKDEIISFAMAIRRVAHTRFWNIREDALKKFSFEKMATKTLAVYRELAPNAAKKQGI